MKGVDVGENYEEKKKNDPNPSRKVFYKGDVNKNTLEYADNIYKKNPGPLPKGLPVFFQSNYHNLGTLII